MTTLRSIRATTDGTNRRALRPSPYQVRPKRRAASPPASSQPGIASGVTVSKLVPAGMRISMDGRGRWMDNVFIERLWRSLKYEAVYLQELADGFAARATVSEWLAFYNQARPHSALGGRTPWEAFQQRGGER